MTARISVELLKEHRYERNEDWDAILVSATCSCGKLLNVPYFDQWLAHLESLQAERDATVPTITQVQSQRCHYEEHNNQCVRAVGHSGDHTFGRIEVSPTAAPRVTHAIAAFDSEAERPKFRLDAVPQTSEVKVSDQSRPEPGCQSCAESASGVCTRHNHHGRSAQPIAHDPSAAPQVRCADCNQLRDNPDFHLDAKGDNWGAALHWFVAPSSPTVEKALSERMRVRSNIRTDYEATLNLWAKEAEALEQEVKRLRPALEAFVNLWPIDHIYISDGASRDPSCDVKGCPDSDNYSGHPRDGKLLEIVRQGRAALAKPSTGENTKEKSDVPTER